MNCKHLDNQDSSLPVMSLLPRPTSSPRQVPKRGRRRAHVPSLAEASNLLLPFSQPPQLQPFSSLDRNAPLTTWSGHTCNLSIQELTQDYKFEASLGYMVRRSQRKKLDSWADGKQNTASTSEPVQPVLPLTFNFTALPTEPACQEPPD